MQDNDIGVNWLKGFVLLAALVILLTACGGDYRTPVSVATAAPPASSSASGLTLVAGSIGGAGNLDGTGAAARFNFPGSMAIDAAGNVFVVDSGNSVIRKITPAGVVSTYAGTSGFAGSTDGAAASARFSFPLGIGIDGAGNLYVLDTNNSTVRKIATDGTVTTLAGTAGTTGSTDGVGAAARFNNPAGLTVDGAGNLFVADTLNHTIRKVTPAGVVSTVAGAAGVSGFADGAPTAARFNEPFGIALDKAGNLYVADSESHTIRKIGTTGIVSTLAGSADAPGSTDGSGALFDHPTGLASDGNGTLYVADSFNNTVRVVTPAGVVSTLAGSAGVKGAADGTGAAARFNDLFAVMYDGNGTVYVGDGYNHTLRKVTLAGAVSTWVGTASVTGGADGTGAAASFNAPSGAAGDGQGNVFVVESGNQTIRKITAAGAVTTFAGTAASIGTADGNGAAARFSFPYAISSDAAGNLYVADAGNNAVRKVTPSAAVTTFAGLAGAARGSADGTGAAARFYAPKGIASDSAGNLLVADTSNSDIRKVTAAGVVSTFAGAAGFVGTADGSGAAANFYDPQGICVDGAGNSYVADSNNDTIRKITSTGVVSTLAGTAQVVGASDGIGAAASFNAPTSIACDAKGNVFVVDSSNNTIRKVTPSGVVSTVAGTAGKVGVTLGALPGTLGSLGGIGVVGTSLYILSENGVLAMPLP